ncbi:DUF6069 family protein [Streptomyces kanamyceticus]|uniref:Uncharacterized protein n=1 Tax=Streptomyces kanamyceticus TaxID=1967 RepID=A0A5J6G464_STRKN|nr:DUF6069 family protein [Streptomyces kanamyceticus]QEU89697.1 hypothetical protein CP970_00865 [Streptomyces kanamyceticus]
MESPNSPYGRSTAPYSVPPPSPDPTPLPPAGPRLDAGRLWAGGVMTAVVAALTAVVALMLVRGVLGIAVFAPESDGAMGDATTGALAGGAAVAALAATALLHLLIAGTPRPERFFAWIVALATAVMVLLPFTAAASLPAKIGTAAVYLLIGVAIGSLLSSVARSAVSRG